MNRFRTKKKAKEAPDGLSRGSTDSDGPAMPALKTSKSFGFGSKKQPIQEPKIELDVANALPSTDDFRTSLLMSGLSARFSMLREQDDPNSKIGKASDDSVLFSSKRQSRLADFGFQPRGLADIEEVASINGSIRPPFAVTRTDSYGSTGSFYGVDDDSLPGGSIMNRAKPGEGNNLFGGRQKIYKIPVSSSGITKDGTGSSGMGGRALYENDVHQSAFQKLRERERELQQEQRDREDAEQSLQDSRSPSPPPSNYNRNRETSSTTSSAGPSITRSSTAATSVTSHRTPSLSGQHTPVTASAPASNGTGLERNVTKTRRLYDTGLDQHMHEQQSSAMSRIDTLTRQRAFGAQTPPLGFNSPTSLVSPVDRWGTSDRQQILGKASMPNMRSKSPSPTTLNGNFDFGPRVNTLGERKQPFGLSSPPLSPLGNDIDDHAVLAVQPNDIGKATALGTFSKPTQPYDENKYSQRQLQMQQDRENAQPRAFVSRHQQQMGRNRAESDRSDSSAQRHFQPQERLQETSVHVSEDETLNSGTFLSSPNSSSSVGSVDGTEVDIQPLRPIKPSDLYNKYRQEPNLPSQRPPESQHPANRHRHFEPQNSQNGAVTPTVTVSMPRLRVEEPRANQPLAMVDHSDSPTLGPTTGLSGMVRQHLRSDSNISSIYGDEDLTSRFPRDTMQPQQRTDYSNKDNPWESDDWDHQSDYGDNNFALETKISTVKDVTSQPISPPPQPFNTEIKEDHHQAPWEKEVETHHKRDGSSTTQKEQRDFKMDLAARRRRVQENLKSFVETENRSVSPMLGGSEWPKEGHLRNNPLTMLKNKTSRGSLIGRPKESASSNKAMKMLGLGSATISSSPSPGKSTFDENSWKNEEEEMMRGVNKPHTAPVVPPPTKAFRQARRDAQRDRERQVAQRHKQRIGQGSDPEQSNSSYQSKSRHDEPIRDRAPPNLRSRKHEPSNERHPPQVANRIQRNGSESQGSIGTKSSGSRPPSRSSRDRSSSDASGRSKSRNGRYRDDLAKAMADGTSQAVLDSLAPPSTHPLTPGLPASPSPLHSPMSRNGNSSRNGYFAGANLQPLQTGDGIEIGLSPRPSPITPFSINSTPSLMPPSPAGSALSGASGANTPTLPGFQNQSRVPGSRKRSVNKSDISEPVFISSTSRVTTVNLPAGSSLQNGSDSNAPPIPPVNPKRKTRAMFGFGKKEEHEVDYSIPAATQSTDEMGTFSAEESEFKPKYRQKLRKSSSEGGGLNVKARQLANAVPGPAMPYYQQEAPPQDGMF
jgi:hypothetical protein